MAEAQFVATELPSPITEFAVSLASWNASQWWASGTAVIVAPYLAITAKHVIEDHWQRLQGEWPETGEAIGHFSLVAFQVPQIGEACLWTVQRMWNSPHTDVTFLKLVPGSTGAAAYQWRWPTMNVLPPAVGTRIAAFGYHSSEIVAGNPVQWQHKAANSFGRVVEVYPQRRDSVLRSYPCFSTDARFEGGMSGGPVFNEAGELCGLICSSIPALESEELHTSYVTSLWPSLGTLLDLNRVGCPPGTYPAIELALGGQMVVRNWERVSVEWDESGASSVSLSTSGQAQARGSRRL